MSMNTGLTGMLRIDSSRNAEYLGPPKPKLNFFQKVGRVFGKALKFLGPIGAAVTAVAVPGLGIPLAAGIYGLSSVAGNLTDNAEIKDSMKMQEWQNANQGMTAVLPGLFDQASQADIKTNFMIPNSMVPNATMTIVDRETAQFSSVENFKFF